MTLDRGAALGGAEAPRRALLAHASVQVLGEGADLHEQLYVLATSLHRAGGRRAHAAPCGAHCNARLLVLEAHHQNTPLQLQIMEHAKSTTSKLVEKKLVEIFPALQWRALRFF